MRQYCGNKRGYRYDYTYIWKSLYKLKQHFLTNSTDIPRKSPRRQRLFPVSSLISSSGAGMLSAKFRKFPFPCHYFCQIKHNFFFDIKAVVVQCVVIRLYTSMVIAQIKQNNTSLSYRVVDVLQDR